MRRIILMLFACIALAWTTSPAFANTIDFDNLGGAYNGAGQTFSFEGVTFTGWSLGDDGQTLYLTDSAVGPAGDPMALITFDYGPVELLGFDLFTTGVDYLLDSTPVSQFSTLGWQPVTVGAQVQNITFMIPSSGFSIVQLDNLSYNPVATPIPGALCLMATALLWITGLRKKYFS